MAEIDAFSSFEQKWLDAHPGIAVASLFLKADDRRLANAFGCLAHELAEAALRIRETPVAAAKVGWWRDELAAAAAGQTRHPVTRQLFADGRSGTLGAAPWVLLADSALTLIDRPPPSDHAALLRQYRPLAAAITRVESLLAFGVANEDDVENDATLWTIDRLARELPHATADADTLPLPLDLLARHGLTRADIGSATPQRTMMLRDHLDNLAASLREALVARIARPLYRRVTAANDARLVAAARSAPDPLECLRHGAPSRHWSNLWLSWREARRLERTRSAP